MSVEHGEGGVMTTEYQCNCTLDGKKYEFLTCNAITIGKALDQFGDYIHDQGSNQWFRAESISLERIEVDE